MDVTMNDFDYILEVVNVVPADLLTATAEGKPRQLRLRCERRDAIMDCATVPTTFDVRNAPGHEYLSCSLVRDVDGSGAYATTDAEVTERLLMGGPHRAVGAVWVHLRAAGETKPSGAAPAEVGRVFVSWRITHGDGQPVEASMLSEPFTTAVAASPMPRFPSLTIVPSTPLAVPEPAAGAAEDPQEHSSPNHFTFTNRGGNARMLEVALLEGSTNSSKPTSEEPQGQGSPLNLTDAGSARGAAAGGWSGLPPAHPSRPVSMLTPRLSRANAGEGAPLAAASSAAHVSIVLDAEQEASQKLLEGDRSTSSRRSPGEGSPKSVTSGSDTTQRSATTSVAGAGSSPATAPTQAELEEAVIAKFPHFSVSVTPPEEEEEKGAETAPITAVVGDAGVHERRVDFYATSTQAIGVVPVQTRHQNLYTAPSPVLLDRLKSDLALPAPVPATGVFSVTSVIPSNGLWRERPRQFGVSRWIAGAGSAQEEIQQEQERRRLLASNSSDGDGTDAAAAATAKPTLMLPKGQLAEVRTESALTLLRQQALDGLRRQRVSY